MAQTPMQTDPRRDAIDALLRRHGVKRVDGTQLTTTDFGKLITDLAPGAPTATITTKVSDRRVEFAIVTFTDGLGEVTTYRVNSAGHIQVPNLDANQDPKSGPDWLNEETERRGRVA